MSKEFQKVSDGLPAPDWINRSETTRLPDPTLSHSAGLLVSLGHHLASPSQDAYMGDSTETAPVFASGTTCHSSQVSELESQGSLVRVHMSCNGYA